MNNIEIKSFAALQAKLVYWDNQIYNNNMIVEECKKLYYSDATIEAREKLIAEKRKKLVTDFSEHTLLKTVYDLYNKYTNYILETHIKTGNSIIEIKYNTNREGVVFADPNAEINYIKTNISAMYKYCEILQNDFNINYKYDGENNVAFSFLNNTIKNIF
jgi:uncharacterized protein YqgQ